MEGVAGLRDDPRVTRLGIGGVAEADGERLAAQAEELADGEDERGRVQAPRKKDADGNVRDEVPGDDALQPPLEVLQQLGLIARIVRGALGEPPVRLRRERAPCEGVRRRRRGFADLREECARAWDEAERQVQAERLGIERAIHARERQDRLQLGREDEASAVTVEVERLLSKAIAREEQRARVSVPQRQREHARELGQRRRAVELEQPQDDFGVGARTKRVPQVLQLGAQLAKVVDLAVVDEREAAIVTLHRLVARRRQILDGEAARAHRDALGDVQPAVVRPAVKDEPIHLREERTVRQARGVYEAVDATHARSLSAAHVGPRCALTPRPRRRHRRSCARSPSR